MRPRRRTTRVAVLAIGLAAAVVVAVTAAVALRPLALEWLAIRALRSDDPAARREGARRLGEMRSVRAVPALVEVLCEEAWWGVYLRSDVGPDDLAHERAYSAARDALLAVGAPAAPALIDVLRRGGAPRRSFRDDLAVSAAAEVLIGMRPPPIPVLARALDDPSPDVRRSAVRILGDIGPEGGEAGLAALVKALRDPDVVAQKAAAETLASFDAAAARAVLPALLEMLEDEDPHAREAADDVLGRLGLAADAVIPALAARLGDDVASVRAMAALSLTQFSSVPASVVPGLAALLDDRDAGVREAAVLVLGELGERDETALEALRRALGHRNVHVRTRAVWVLAESLPPDRAVPLLRTSLADDDATVREQASAAIDWAERRRELTPP